MPYFKWRGVDLTGAIRVGKTFARSKDELDGLLLDREVALIYCASFTPLALFRSVGLDAKIDFFRQLAVLLDAGVMLPEALKILSSLVVNIRLRTVINAVAFSVQEGLPLSKAFEGHPKIFDFLTIKMMRVGQETGKLQYALQQVSDYLDSANTFRKKLKSAAMIPLITFSFFAFIASSIFIFIVPRFESIFKSVKKELPSVTKFIIKTSQALRSSVALWIVAGIILFVVAVVQFSKTTRGKKFFDRFVLRVPWFGDLNKNTALVYFLHSVSMLLGSGVRLLKAMSIASKSIKNTVLKQQVSQLESEVASGISLSQSMKQLAGSLFADDLISLAKVGEESGNLGPMLKRGADIYQEKVNRSITFFTTVFQPLLMIILGLLITLLIFAIYLPVFNLGHVI